jgi:uncharacterized membrane protein
MLDIILAPVRVTGTASEEGHRGISESGEYVLDKSNCLRVNSTHRTKVGAAMSDEDKAPIRVKRKIAPIEERRANVAFIVLFMCGILPLFFGLSGVFTRGMALGYRLILIVCGFAFIFYGISRTFEAEKRSEERRKEDVKRILAEDPASDYFEKLVNINVENLSAYYVTVKGHANKSFITALFVGIVGFVLIGIGIYLSVTDLEHSSVTQLAGISGVATEFISAVFFYLYNQTVRQMKEYHDSLLAVQNILLSFKLVGDTSDPKDKATMIGVMLQYLVGKRSGESDRKDSRPGSTPDTDNKADTKA